ncbi:folylpolyglutamate synthase/dihydrofolate synthase family protein [Candidatus Legionella polyplacis]|uniref:Dihydrofolate synthase/folylpolyglutamate synthase n=1 Tax=Candidatus Legionella polyplacis TaxID=2005262 RepID=A0ABZ2H1D7_9GAMM
MKDYKKFVLVDWLDKIGFNCHLGIKLGLDKVKLVAEELGLLKNNRKVITISGTNGKGSTVAILESIYISLGYNVGSYTSPHLFKINERIKINNKQISDESLCKAFYAVEEVRDQLKLTSFEMITLAALWYFKKYFLDLIILEVGLGGRLDAVNIIDSDLSIITTVDFDHQNFLGSDRESIAYEKSGILREGKPFIFADNDIPERLLIESMKLNCPTYILGRDYNYFLDKKNFYFSYKQDNFLFPMPFLHKNSVSAAIMASFCLKKYFPVNLNKVSFGIKNTYLPGRLQIIKKHFFILLDVSHNLQSVKYLYSFVDNFYLKNRKCIYTVFSAFKDKDIINMIGVLKEIVDCWYISLLFNERSVSKDQLLDVFDFYCLKFSFHKDPVESFYSACRIAKSGDLIIVFGSFLTVSSVLSILN